MKKTIKSRRRRDFFKGKLPQKPVFLQENRPDQGAKRQRSQKKGVSEEGTFRCRNVPLVGLLSSQGAGRKPSRHVTASSWKGFFVFGFRGVSLSNFCADFFHRYAGAFRQKKLYRYRRQRGERSGIWEQKKNTAKFPD